MNASAWFSAEESNCPAERKILELKGLELERTVLNMDTVSEPFWNNQKLVWGGGDAGGRPVRLEERTAQAPQKRKTQRQPPRGSLESGRIFTER